MKEYYHEIIKDRKENTEAITIEIFQKIRKKRKESMKDLKNLSEEEKGNNRIRSKLF